LPGVENVRVARPWTNSSFSAFAFQTLSHTLHMRQTLALDPLSLPGNAMLGIVFAAQDRLPEARVQLQKALELNPGFPLTQTFLGEVEAALGDHAEALRPAGFGRIRGSRPSWPGESTGRA